MANNGPIEVDMALNASGVARGADDAKQALRDLGDVFDGLDDAGSSMALDDSLKDAESAAKNAERAVDDVSSAVDGLDDKSRAARLDEPLKDATDAAKDAERAVDGLGDRVDTTSRSGETDLEKLEAAMREVQRQTDDTKRSVGDVGSVGTSSFSALRDKGVEVGDELRANLGETFSSFRGDLQDLPQIAQDTLGGLAGSGALGGIPGLAATAAGAAGIGLIIAALDDASQRAEWLRDRASEISQAYIEAGTDTLDAVSLASRAMDVLSDPEAKQRAQDMVDVVGIDMATAIRIVAGDAEALATAQGAVADAYRKNGEQMDEHLEKSDAYQRMHADEYSNLQIVADELIRGRDLLGQYADNNAEAAGQAQLFSDVLKGLISDADSASVQVDKLGNKVVTLPDGKQVYIDAETGQASLNLDGFKGDLDEIDRKQVNPKVVVQVDDWAWRNWQPGNKTASVQTYVVPGFTRGEVAQLF